jgi:hypothetical protein
MSWIRSYVEGIDRAAQQPTELLGITRPVEGYPQLRQVQIDRRVRFFRVIDDDIKVEQL